MNILKRVRKTIRIIFFIGTMNILMIAIFPLCNSLYVNVATSVFVWLIIWGIYEYEAYKAKRNEDEQGFT